MGIRDPAQPWHKHLVPVIDFEIHSSEMQDQFNLPVL